MIMENTGFHKIRRLIDNWCNISDLNHRLLLSEFEIRQHIVQKLTDAGAGAIIHRVSL